MGKRFLSNSKKISSTWILLYIALLLIGCSSYQFNIPQFTPTSATEILTLNIDYTAEKALYDKISRTLFVMNENQIELYRNNRLINTIGKMGLGSQNFNNLSDIALSPSGDLLALDSFKSIFYRYDNNGRLISSFPIKKISNPQLLLQVNDESIYIYDSASNEIFLLDLINSDQLLSFGKFTFEKPQSISYFKDQIYLYDTTLDQTIFFNSFGQELENISGHIIIDQFQKYSLEKYYFEHFNSAMKFAISPQIITDIYTSNGVISLIQPNKITVLEIKYAKQN